MASRKEKEILFEHDQLVKDLRYQFSDQLKSVDARLEMHQGMLVEMMDFFRKRAEIEEDYARSLDKLFKSFMARHKSEKQRREHWPQFSTFRCWNRLLLTCRRLSRDHQTYADLCRQDLSTCLSDLNDDLVRLARQCKDLLVFGHDDINDELAKLQIIMKDYHGCHQEKLIALDKLRLAQNQYSNAVNSTIRKHFLEDLGDLLDCMEFGYYDSLSQTLAMTIQMEHCLHESRANVSVELREAAGELNPKLDKNRFISLNANAFSLPRKLEFQAHRTDEVSNFLNNDSVLHNVLDRFNQCSSATEDARLQSSELWKTLEACDRSMIELVQHDYAEQVAEKFAANHAAASQHVNELSKISALDQTFEASSAAMSASQSPHDATGADYQPAYQMDTKMKKTRQDTEGFYFGKFRDFLKESRRHHRLQSRCELMRPTIDPKLAEMVLSGQLPTRPGGCDGRTGAVILANPSAVTERAGAAELRKRRIGQTSGRQVKLFGGSIDEYCEMNECDVPIVVQSCVRTLQLHGALHQQGLFRVPGAKLEIDELKKAFENGEDPLLSSEPSPPPPSQSLNSVAGVLKLYFRELADPLFPIALFEEFVSTPTTRCPVEHLRDLVLTLKRPVAVTMRFLFSFLEHLSEFSDETQMDAYNLAICLGPTLLPIPQDRDQVLYQQRVIDTVKLMISRQDRIFSALKVDGALVYVRCDKIVQSITNGTADPNESQHVDSTASASAETKTPPTSADLSTSERAGTTAILETDLDEEDDDEDEIDMELIEARAKYDFTARTEREISFHKGDLLVLFQRVSPDWWEGCCRGREGLIPDKFVSLNVSSPSVSQRSVISQQLSGRPTERNRSSSTATAPDESTGSPAESSVALRLIESGFSESPVPRNHLLRHSLTENVDTSPLTQSPQRPVSSLVNTPDGPPPLASGSGLVLVTQTSVSGGSVPAFHGASSSPDQPVLRRIGTHPREKTTPSPTRTTVALLRPSGPAAGGRSEDRLSTHYDNVHWASGGPAVGGGDNFGPSETTEIGAQISLLSSEPPEKPSRRQGSASPKDLRRRSSNGELDDGTLASTLAEIESDVRDLQMRRQSELAGSTHNAATAALAAPQRTIAGHSGGIYQKHVSGNEQKIKLRDAPCMERKRSLGGCQQATCSEQAATTSTPVLTVPGRSLLRPVAPLLPEPLLAADSMEQQMVLLGATSEKKTPDLVLDVHQAGRQSRSSQREPTGLVASTKPASSADSISATSAGSIESAAILSDGSSRHDGLSCTSDSLSAAGDRDSGVVGTTSQLASRLTSSPADKSGQSHPSGCPTESHSMEMALSRSQLFVDLKSTDIV